MGAQADRIRRQLEQSLAGVKDELTNRMVDKLRERTPVRTGYTRSRWTVVESGLITNDQGDTVMRLNDGSSRQVAAGFIEQVIDETIVEVKREVEK
jgi:hypothetical protein